MRTGGALGPRGTLTIGAWGALMLAVSLVASGALAACGEAGYAPSTSGAAADGGLAGPDVASETADVATGEPGTDAVADAGPAARPPAFEIGSNPQGANTPAAFTALSDGDPLEIVFGPQGLWMVVLAFRTRGLVTAPLALEAEIRTADRTLGALSLVDQPLFPGPEGWSYHYNFFLVVDDPTASGRAATIAFSGEDAQGGRLGIEREVTLTGGL